MLASSFGSSAERERSISTSGNLNVFADRAASEREAAELILSSAVASPSAAMTNAATSPLSPLNAALTLPGGHPTVRARTSPTPTSSSSTSPSSPAASMSQSSPDTPTLVAFERHLPSRYMAEFIQGARLGKGGFGRVYRARHVLDGFEYAVKKVLLTGSTREQERAVREATCLAKLDHPNVVRYYQVWKEELEGASLEALAEFEDSEEEDSLEGEESFSAPTEDDCSPGRSRFSRMCSEADVSQISGLGGLPRGNPAVLHIQMQLCELTLRDYLKEQGRDTTLDGHVNRPYLLQLFAGLQHIHRQSLIHRDLTPANIFITYDAAATPASPQQPPLPNCSR